MNACRNNRALAATRALVAAILFFLPAAPTMSAASEPQDVPTSLVSTLAAVAVSSSRFSTEMATAWSTAREEKLSAFITQAENRLSLLERVRSEAALAGLPPDLVLAVIHVESAFDDQALSSAGAQGLMQIMPFWKEAIGRPEDDLYEARLNLRYGCTILAYYLNLEQGDLTRALARYNGSLGKTWYPERVMRAWREHWRTPSSD